MRNLKLTLKRKTKSKSKSKEKVKNVNVHSNLEFYILNKKYLQTMIKIITSAALPMIMFILMFCHHIFLLTLLELTRNSSALDDNISERSSKWSSRDPRSNIFSIFSCMMFDTSLTCSFNLNNNKLIQFNKFYTNLLLHFFISLDMWWTIKEK